MVLTEVWANLLKKESFAENQKHHPAAKAVCSVNTNMVKNASFTIIDVH